MAKKIIAYLKTDNGFKVLNVYQAIKLKNSSIKNRDKEISFYDTPDEVNGEKMNPVKTSKNGRMAHFSYYPGATHVGIGSDMSMTHRLYIIALSQVKEFELYQFGERIKVYVKSAKPEFYFCTDNNRYFLDVMIELKKTEPYSYYYKWNGRLALEILVKHKVDKFKVNDLEVEGLQIFEVKVYKENRIPDEFENQQQYDYYKSLLLNRVAKGKIVGKFVNDVYPQIGTEMERRYQQLTKFEAEIEELKDEIEINTKKIDEQNRIFQVKKEEIKKLEKQKHNLETQISLLKNDKNKIEREFEETQKFQELYSLEHSKNSELVDELEKERKKVLFRLFLKELKNISKM